MKVVVHGEVTPYLDRVRPFLRRDEALHNLPLGVLGQVEQGIYDEWILATVENGDELAGMLFRTPPWPWTVALFDGDVDVYARTVGDHLARHASLPAEVNGAASPAAAVADRWAVAAGAVAQLAMAMRIMDCTELAAPAGDVPGAPRRVQRDHLDVIVPWLAAFEAEALSDSDPRDESEIRGLVERSLEGGRSPFWVWERDGEVVSLAGIGRPTGTGERVGPVYTPSEHRGHGYAGALVRHLTAGAFERGCDHVFLFTDAANPVSNRLYERLGYRHVGDAARYAVRLP